MTIHSNKYLNHWISNNAVFAISIGFGPYIRIGFSVVKYQDRDYWFELQLIYWRVFIGGGA